MILFASKPDSSFIRNEILAFKEVEESIVVYYSIYNPVPEDLKSIARFIRIPESKNRFSLRLVFKHFKDLILILLSTPFQDHLHAIKNRAYPTIIVIALNAIDSFKKLDDQALNILRNEEVVFSFWFYDVMLATMLKRKGVINKLYARAHRGDTYEGHIGVRTLFFRRLFLKNIDHLYPISKNASSFIKGRYPKYRSKISHVYLGSFRYFRPELSAKPKRSHQIIVSCSWIVNKKRVHEIPAILSHLEVPFEWHHFGSGNAEQEALVLKSIEDHGLKDKVVLHGKTDNREIQRFYHAHQPDCFLSVSSSEGVPVSFMEAISYGIPIVATDVGGNAELVTNEVGALLNCEARPEQFAHAIERTSSKLNSLRARQQMLELWNRRFSIIQNNGKILEQIKL